MISHDLLLMRRHLQTVRCIKLSKTTLIKCSFILMKEPILIRDKRTLTTMISMDEMKKISVDQSQLFSSHNDDLKKPNFLT